MGSGAHQVGTPGGVEDGAADGRVGEDARPRDDGRHDLGDVVQSDCRVATFLFSKQVLGQ